MGGTFTVACVQTTQGREVAPNIEAASALVRGAAKAGADFILMPENTNLMEPQGKLLPEKTMAEDGDPALKAFCGLAKELGVWLLPGSLILKGEREKSVNRSFLISPEGDIKARYDKIHMFDVDLGEGESYRESKRYDGFFLLPVLPVGQETAG